MMPRPLRTFGARPNIRRQSHFMTKTISLLGILMAALLAAVTARPAVANDEVRRILADLIMDAAVGLSGTSEPLPLELELSVALGLEAAIVAGDDADLWRAVLQLADVADAGAIGARALTEITRLDPRDEIAALRRLLHALDRLGTVEERERAVTSLLRKRRLPATMASRVAFDLALVLQRAGDLEGYLEWLSEAVALDPSNAPAVSDLAGYLVGTTAETTLQAELLMARCLANPTYLPAIERFASFLSERGADRGARRLQLLLLSLDGGAARASIDERLLPAAISSWASGDAQQALDLVQRRQEHLDGRLRAALSAIRQSVEAMRPIDDLVDGWESVLDPATGKKLRQMLADAAPGAPSAAKSMRAVAPSPVQLAAFGAAVTSPEVQPDGEAHEQHAKYVAAMRDAIESILEVWRESDQQGNLSIFVWLAFWLLHDDADDSWLMRTFEPVLERHGDELDEAVRGWVVLRTVGAVEALEILEPLADENATAALGAALALLELNRRQAAATRLLSVARSVPETFAGVWARRCLERQLGVRIPLHPDSAAVDAIAATMPSAFDRLLLQPTRLLAFTVKPVRDDFALFDRVEVRLEITNRSDLPLSISPTGPITTTVAVPLEMTTFGVRSESARLRHPIFVDIGQRLRLDAWETLTIRANLSRGVVSSGTTFGRSIVDLTPIGGNAAVRGRAILNPRSTTRGGLRGLVEPGLLGTETAPLAFRCLGPALEPAWFEETVAMLSDLDQPPDPVRTVTLLAWTVRADSEYSDQRNEVILGSVPRLPPEWQAVACMLLTPGRLPQVEQMMRNSPDRLVRIASMLSFMSSSTDPLLDETRRGDDPQLRRIAELIAAVLEARSMPGR